MISMSYDLAKLPVQSLLKPISAAGTALVRLDERISRSKVGSGWIERSHFADACASLWVDGELVTLEDFLLHDATRDVRAPSHELTIAADVLKTRRRIVGQPASWALSARGLKNHCRAGSIESSVGWEGEGTATAAANEDAINEGEGSDAGEDVTDPLGRELAAIDALLARSESAIAAGKAPRRGGERDLLVYEADWDEQARLDAWRAVLSDIQNLLPVLQTVVALDAWNSLAVLQHASWVGRLLAAAIPRQAGLSTSGHLVALTSASKPYPSSGAGIAIATYDCRRSCMVSGRRLSSG